MCNHYFPIGIIHSCELFLTNQNVILSAIEVFYSLEGALVVCQNVLILNNIVFWILSCSLKKFNQMSILDEKT
jgi:hypothetical protein